MKDLENEAASTELVQWTSQDKGSLIEKLAGDDAMMAWIDEANDPEEFSDDDDDEVDVIDGDNVDGNSSEKDVVMSDATDDDDDSSGEGDVSSEEDKSSSESEEKELCGRAACLRNGKCRKVKPSGF